MIISAIIPTYNEAKYISRCLLSLQRQQLDAADELEIIIIDDGSTDETVEKVKHFLKSRDVSHTSPPQDAFNAPLHLLHQQHQGPAVARNRAAKTTKGEILVFVDADMEFDQQFIKYLIKPIKEGKVKGTFSKEEFVANWDNPWARCWNWNQDLPAKKRLPDSRDVKSYVSTIEEGTDFRAILKSEFNRVNGFDNTGYTDTWTLPHKLGYQPIAAAGAIFYHHNPGDLFEVFTQARWVGKRRYKLGAFGLVIALARASLPISLIVGLFKSLKYHETLFGVFKIVYDLGITIGILEMVVKGKLSK